VYDLHQEQKELAALCPQCGFRYPVMPETADSTAVFKDVDVPVLEPVAGD
jgi:DNA-directed RNA polymerase subunit RPC12/RpoP